jgi:hypothetical protein
VNEHIRAVRKSSEFLAIGRVAGKDDDAVAGRELERIRRNDRRMRDEERLDAHAVVAIHDARSGNLVRYEQRARVDAAFVRDADRDIVGMIA